MDDGDILQQRPVPFSQNMIAQRISTIAPAVYPPMSHWVRIIGPYIPSFYLSGDGG